MDPLFVRRRRRRLTGRTAAAVVTVFSAVRGCAAAELVSRLAHAPCVRLFHSGGDVGCRATEPGGLTLPLYSVSEEAHFALLEAEPGGSEVAAVLPPSFFNASILARLEATGRLGGVLVQEGAAPSATLASRPGAGFSTAPNTPQGDTTPTYAFDLDPSYEWNRHGSGMLMASRPYPMALLRGTDAADAAADGAANREAGVDVFPRHTVQLSFYFGPAGVTSGECLRWVTLDGALEPQCLPLGGQSVWGVASGAAGTKPLALAVATMDGAGVFPEAAPAANSAASGLAALLAAADALATAASAAAIDLAALPRQVGFAAFQADAWGFTGSRRFVADAFGAGDGRGADFECANRVAAADAPQGLDACVDPLYPNLEFAKLGGKNGDGGVVAVVALDQIGVLAEPWRLSIHRSSGASDKDAAAVLAAGAGLPGGFAAAATAGTGGALPPTPLTPFVRVDPGVAGFVIAGYDGAFADPLYQTHWEEAAAVDTAAVAAAALVAARAIYRLAGGDAASAAAISVNTTLVSELLTCLTGAGSRSNEGAAVAGVAECTLATAYVQGELTNIAEYLGEAVSVPTPDPPTSYAGVLSPWEGGGLPLLQRTAKEGSGGTSYFARYANGTFDAAAGDRIRLLPSWREMFVRAFLAEQLARATAGAVVGCKSNGGSTVAAASTTATTACASSADCPGAGACAAVVGLATTAKTECVHGACVCPLAHYHLAMDVGLRRTESPQVFEIVDAAAPLWAEPNWGRIGVKSYYDPGRGIGGAALIAGLLFMLVAGVASQVLHGRLKKQKLI